MLYIKNTVVLAIILLLPLSMSAQKQQKKRAVKKSVVETPQEDPRITSMREMTQQIIIIDSIVTDKNQMLSFLRFSDETGRILSSSEFFGKGDSTTVFVNEMGNKAYFSQPDDSLHQQLYTCDLLGGEWSCPQPLKGISEGISEAAYPFMLADGLTFYFAGKGEESIGGYDIFMTRYDARSNSFLKPENIGMPFNSEANDYLFAIDEYARIGYFVSDRRQPEGKVCVYIFIPTTSRKTYDPIIFTEAQIRGFADINCIADTWGNGQERNDALARYHAIIINNMKATNTNAQPEDNTMASPQLIINDALTYSSAKDFQSLEAAVLYKQLIEARQQLCTISYQLQKSRNYYPKATGSEKQSLAREILQAETDLMQLYSYIQTLEKETRNAEIKIIQ
jgi:hypothetical protein